MGTLVLLDLMGGVALLLWGLHMVQSGIMRAFGPDLRRILSRALCNRVAAFGAGLGLTALLQSSTATGLMTASFAAEGAVGLVPALAIMLGANVGTTLIVCNASSINPRPMATRPQSLIRLCALARNATRPTTKSTGATAAMLNDKT
jgi:Na+/Pi-cotransporter